MVKTLKHKDSKRNFLLTHHFLSCSNFFYCFRFTFYIKAGLHFQSLKFLCLFIFYASSEYSHLNSYVCLYFMLVQTISFWIYRLLLRLWGVEEGSS
ncbi:hypothetical protein Hanom_Chr17g01565231 [Helianthus anomalus]